jgi:hypothetical protein
VDFGDQIEKVFKSYIGRVVAFVLAPLLAIAVPPLTVAVNNVLGTGFSDGEIATVAIAAVVGVALAVFQWLRNLGNWEAKAQEAYMLYRAGEQNLAAVEAQQGIVASEPDVSAEPLPNEGMPNRPDRL